jgi:hypothetical protein
LEQLKNQNDLNILLNHPPKPEWIKEHPFINRKDPNTGEWGPLQYLPIERVEYLLTSIFILWRTEVRQVQMIANSILVTVRVHYRNPVTDEMEWQDGLGASPIQTDEGASATDFSKVKSGAIMMAAPAAKSFAIKDAAEMLGKIFGKDLNRADQIAYESMAGKFDETPKWRQILSEKIGMCQDEEITGKVMNEVNEIEAKGIITVEDYKDLLKKHFDYEMPS